MTMPRRRSPCSFAPQRTRDIPRRRRAEDADVRVETRLDAHLSCLRTSSIRNDAHGLLAIFLRMYGMQNPVEAEGGRLLRVLFLRGHAMPVDTRSAGERPDGVLLLIERSLIRQSRSSPFCATLPFCCITQSLHLWDVVACFKYLGVHHHRECPTKVDLSPRLAGNDRCLRI
jgi:hypothetical protein